MVSRGLRWRL